MASCIHCGGNLVWQNDFDFEDCGYDGCGVVTFWHCSQCGAEIEVKLPLRPLPTEEEEDEDEV